MKVKEGFMLREIADIWVVVPLGQRVVEFNGIMTLNESGAFIWKMLEVGVDIDEIINGIMCEYEIDRAVAKADIEEFISQIAKKELILQ